MMQSSTATVGQDQRPQLEVRKYRSIEEINPALWDSLFARDGLVGRYNFIRSLQNSQIEKAKYWYLLIYRGDEFVGAAALSSFTVSLDLLNPGLLGIAALVRKVMPQFLRIETLFCGLPISLGKSCICSKYESLDDAIVDCVVFEMERIARANGINITCAKEFSTSRLARTQQFKKHGYFCANSIPRVEINIVWPDYATYLGNMRAGYRRQVVASLRRAGLCVSNPIFDNPSCDPDNQAHLELAIPTAELAAVIAAQYKQVMSRVAVKMEVLNEAFFVLLFESMVDDLEVLLLRKQDCILGAALLYQNGSRLHFLLVGMDYARRDEYDTYFCLLNGIIALAITRQCTAVDLGQTSYYAKSRIGGEAENLYFYLRARQPVINAMLRICRPVFFPQTQVPKMRVFRNDTTSRDRV